jgi:hypothetical protein
LERLRARDFGRGKIMSLEGWSLWEKRLDELIQIDATGEIAKVAARFMQDKMEIFSRKQ